MAFSHLGNSIRIGCSDSLSLLYQSLVSRLKTVEPCHSLLFDFSCRLGKYLAGRSNLVTFMNISSSERHSEGTQSLPTTNRKDGVVLISFHVQVCRYPGSDIKEVQGAALREDFVGFSSAECLLRRYIASHVHRYA